MVLDWLCVLKRFGLIACTVWDLLNFEFRYIENWNKIEQIGILKMLKIVSPAPPSKYHRSKTSQVLELLAIAFTQWRPVCLTFHVQNQEFNKGIITRRCPEMGITKNLVYTISAGVPKTMIKQFIFCLKQLNKCLELSSKKDLGAAWFVWVKC